MLDASKGWRADCFRTSMSRFDQAYAKAQASSQPQDWMDAALLAQQFRNVAYAVLTGEAPKQLRPLPFNMDERAQAAVLADLPPSIAQEAGEFYENADAGRPKGSIRKRDAMAVAWRAVLRPYLIGLRDQHDTQARPEDAASWRRVAERLETEMQELLTVCDCEIRDMTHNRQTKDKQSAAYADGALRVAKGIAHRIRAKSETRR